ncbi:UNVERIFIED_CONTAM: hypothetical protein K2H54_052225 [Gekko kuhli]
MATDGTGKPEKLLYGISVPPVHGQIEYINYPGMPISLYSQLDVVAQKICYIHDNSHEASKDSFSHYNIEMTGIKIQKRPFGYPLMNAVSTSS